MVTTRGRASGSYSGSSAKSIDEQVREFITSGDYSWYFGGHHYVFGAINEGIMELLDERLGLSGRDLRGIVRSTNSLFLGVQGLWRSKVLFC